MGWHRDRERTVWSLEEGQGSQGAFSAPHPALAVEGTVLWPALVVPVPSGAAPEHAAFPAVRGVGTCAQEKHLIAPVCRVHLVHGHSGEAVVDVGAHHQRLAVRGVHGVVHQRVRAHEVDHFVGVVLGRLHGGGEGPPGALWHKHHQCLVSWHPSTGLRVPAAWQALAHLPAPPGAYLRCLDGGRAFFLCRASTGSSVPPCGQRAH